VSDYLVENISFDEPVVTVRAANAEGAALAWGRTRGDAWWEAVPRWPDGSTRSVDVFVYPPEYALEFIVVLQDGEVSVAQAP
jgi:hypothetical protein